MAVVRVEPLGAELVVEPGETVANAAWRLGYQWPTRCWGQAECMICRVRVVAGEDGVAPPAEEEALALEQRLGLTYERDGVRLACRMEVRRDAGIVVEKEGVVAPPLP
jgi:2Fe-2S ferredoxin